MKERERKRGGRRERKGEEDREERKEGQNIVDTLTCTGTLLNACNTA